MKERSINASLYALSLLRLIAGFTFALYGAKLLLGAFGGADNAGHAAPFFSLLGVAGALEFFGGCLVAVGLFTRPVAFILSGQMAVAYFLEHFPQGWNPILNGGTPSVLYSFTFLYIAATGAGPIGLDRLLRRIGPSRQA